MAKPGHAYPQVEPGVAALMDSRVLGCAPAVTVARALARARAAGATVIALGARRAARVSELARAAAWGLDRRPVVDVAWRDLPTVAAGASEVEARRHLRAGASLILVRRGSRVIGAVDRDRVEYRRPNSPSSRGWSSRVKQDHWATRGAGSCARPARSAKGWARRPTRVGGFVRDLLAGAVPPDVDLVVEGDGVAFARRLAEEIGGTVLVHRSFGTASIEGGARRRAPNSTASRSAGWTWPRHGVSTIRRPGRCPRSTRRRSSRTCAVATSR